MTRTGTDPMDRWRFPDDPWAIVETAPSTDDLGTVSYTHLTLPTILLV